MDADLEKAAAAAGWPDAVPDASTYATLRLQRTTSTTARSVHSTFMERLNSAAGRAALRDERHADEAQSMARSVDLADVLDDEADVEDDVTAERSGSEHADALAEAAAEKDPFEVSWDGGDADPANPRSMATARKWLIVVVTCGGAMCVTCASSIYTSTYTPMDAEFHVSRIVATLGLSTFVLGIALGPVWSPLSEFYGRRPIYIGSFLLFLIWIIPSAVARNIETMIIARFFQGFAGSAFLSVAGGTVGDLFNRDGIQGPMAFFSAAPFVGPAIGPLIGGFINTYTNWRWTHYVLIIWSFVILLALILLVPETYHPVLLRNKARRLRRATGDARWQAPLEKLNAQRSVAHTIGLSLLRPFALLIYEPMCLCLNLYSAILLGVLYLFFGAIPLVLENSHGFVLWQCGLAFLGLFVGMVGGAITAPLWVRVRRWLMVRRQAATGEAHLRSEPEDRLPSVMMGAVLVSTGLFWFGWSTFPHVHWIMPIIGSGIFAMGTILAFSGVFTFLVEVYVLYGASALSSNALVRCSFAAAFPLFGLQMYEKLGYQWASTLLAFLTVAMLPFPFLFFRYGKQLRARSRYAAA